MNKYLLLGMALLIPLMYGLGLYVGAKQERHRQEQQQLLANAANDVRTVSEVFKVKKDYEPIYIEVPKYVDPPKCAVPAVIRDTISRLPGRNTKD